MSGSAGKIVRGAVGGVIAGGLWLLLARLLFLVHHPSDLRDAGGRTWLGLALIAVGLAALVLVAVLRLGGTGPRTGALSLRLGWPGVVAVSACLLGGAVATTTMADRFAHAAANDSALQVAHFLVEQTQPLPLAEATAYLRAHAQLGIWSAVWVAPSGLLLPEEVAAQVAGWPSVEVPLAGALSGGRLRVAWQPHLPAHLPVVAIALLVVLLALVHATTIAARIARDIGSVTAQVQAVATDAGPTGPSRTTAWSSELRRLTISTNRLLDRVPRLTMASFVAIERANEAQRFKSQFLANMSHDLRSPLNSILGFSELLLRGLEGELGPAETAALAAIHARGLALLRLLGEILDTAKAESGRMELRRQPIAPAELIQQALSETRRCRAAPTPGTATATTMPVSMERLRIELQPGLAPVFVDPLRMQQALTHLFNHLLDEPDERPVDVRVADALVDEGDRRKRYLIVDVALPVGAAADATDDIFDGFLPARRQAAAQNAPAPAPDGKVGHTSAGAANDLRLALPLARRLALAHGGDLVLTQPISAPAPVPAPSSPSSSPSSSYEDEEEDGAGPSQQESGPRRHLRLTVPSGDEKPVGAGVGRRPVALSVGKAPSPASAAPAKKP